LLGLCVGLLGLGDQLLLVLVLVLGGGGALRRRDCPLVVEAVEDTEAEGRVSEDLEAGGKAGVSCLFLVEVLFSKARPGLGGVGRAEVRCGDGGTHVDSGRGRHFDQAAVLYAPIAVARGDRTGCRLSIEGDAGDGRPIGPWGLVVDGMARSWAGREACRRRVGFEESWQVLGKARVFSRFFLPRDPRAAAGLWLS
jgi:hypothetical protein